MPVEHGEDNVRLLELLSDVPLEPWTPQWWFWKRICYLTVWKVLRNFNICLDCTMVCLEKL